MKNISKRILSVVLMLGILLSLSAEAFAAVSYMPDVTPEMSDADFWASLSNDPDAVMMTREEIKASDVAICKDREAWLGAWDIADDEVLVVTGNKVYTII